VLRDVDHYLTGEIQAWRKFLPFPANLLAEGPTKDPVTILLGNYAAIQYDNEKRESFVSNPKPDEKNAKSSRDQDSKPASAPGGRFWAWMGGQHLLTRDHPDQQANPSKLKITYEDVKSARKDWSFQKIAFELSYGVAKDQLRDSKQGAINFVEGYVRTLLQISQLRTGLPIFP
jgi:hypothetical protein